MREYLIDFMNEFEYPEEAKTELLEAYDSLMKNGECKEEIENLLKTYEENYNFDYGIIFDKTPKMEEKIGVHRYKIELVIYILFSKHLKKLYNDNNIDESIWYNSMCDLKYKLLECKAVKNIWGSFVAWWFSGFFNLKRFALGRLQFEIGTYYHDNDYVKDGKRLSKGMKMLDVHIPRTLTPLDKPSYDAAFDMAREFFKDKLGDAPMAFTCSSWLLYPNYADLLPERSNIRKFMLEFDVVATREDEPGKYWDMWRVFDMDYTGNFDDYPEDSSLRRAIKGYLKSGGKTGTGFGIFFA